MANENPPQPAAQAQVVVNIDAKKDGDAKPADAAPAVAPAAASVPATAPVASTDAAKPAVAVPAAADPAVVVATAQVVDVKPTVLPQQPTEPVFQLKLDPDQNVVFKSNKLTEGTVTTTVKLTNTTKVLHVYKIKCTSIELFRVTPPLNYIKPGETASIKFSLTTKSIPEDGKHYFAFYHMSVNDDDKKKSAMQRWTPNTKPDGVKRLPVRYLKNDGSSWTTPASAVATATVIMTSPAAAAVAPASAPPEKK